MPTEKPKKRPATKNEGATITRKEIRAWSTARKKEIAQEVDDGGITCSFASGASCILEELETFIKGMPARANKRAGGLGKK